MGCNFLYCASLKCRLEQNARGYCEMPIGNRPMGQTFFLQFPLQLEQIEITVEETEGVIMCGTLHNVQAAKPNEQREIEQERERGSGGEMCSLSQRWGGV